MRDWWEISLDFSVSLMGILWWEISLDFSISLMGILWWEISLDFPTSLMGILWWEISTLLGGVHAQVPILNPSIF